MSRNEHIEKAARGCVAATKHLYECLRNEFIEDGATDRARMDLWRAGLDLDQALSLPEPQPEQGAVEEARAKFCEAARKGVEQLIAKQGVTGGQAMGGPVRAAYDALIAAEAGAGEASHE